MDDTLTNAEIHDLVREEVERILSPRGFEQAGVLKWACNRATPIRHLFGFAKWQGGQFAPRWGVSLDFVPHFSGDDLRWHCSNKSALFDLQVDPFDRVLDQSYISGSSPVVQRHKPIVAEVITRAEHFWALCTEVRDLPKAMEWLQSNGYPRVYSETRFNMASMFVAAGMGRMDEAQAAFEKVCSRRDLRPKTRDRLERLLVEAGRDPIVVSPPPARPKRKFLPWWR